MSQSARNLKILIAPNAFKESLSAPEVAKSLKRGLGHVFLQKNLFTLPVADGGDGSLEVVTRVLGLETRSYNSFDPFNRPLKARIGFSKDRQEAYIEMALATGLHLLQNDEKNAAIADSYGTGILIKKAIESSCKEINLFVGGTASMDGGTGILRALGFEFLDKSGKVVTGGGINIGRIRDYRFKLDYDLKEIKINIFSDVDNALTGKRGSVAVFGPQKDNGSTNMKELGKSFESFAQFLEKVSGRDIKNIPGSGAAGGTPAGLAAFLDVNILKGAENIIERCGFDEIIKKADLVITGEGKLDEQSLEGKAPFVVAKKARESGKKVIFVGGSIPEKAKSNTDDLFDAVFSITPGPVSLEKSIKNASLWLERIAFQIAKLIENL